MLSSGVSRRECRRMRLDLSGERVCTHALAPPRKLLPSLANHADNMCTHRRASCTACHRRRITRRTCARIAGHTEPLSRPTPSLLLSARPSPPSFGWLVSKQIYSHLSRPLPRIVAVRLCSPPHAKHMPFPLSIGFCSFLPVLGLSLAPRFVSSLALLSIRPPGPSCRKSFSASAPTSYARSKLCKVR